MIRMMFAAPASGSGKTAVACGMLALLKRMNRKVCAFKCGPDYIDPMFHRGVLDVESHNLDLFLSDEAHVKAQYAKYSTGYDAVVCEGVMGYYDGVGGTTVQASAWHLADVLELPVILVMRPKSASLTLAAQIRGMCSLRTPHYIVGVILNECTPMLFSAIGRTLEQESGIPVLGFLPSMEEAAFESRHLGLYTANEIEDLNIRIGTIADAMEKTVDLERLMQLCNGETLEDGSGSEGEDTWNRTGECSGPAAEAADAAGAGTPRDAADGPAPIAVAKDDAFCFLYRESLDVLEEAGAKLCYFSPLQDDALPEGVGGLYLPGGYPELYAAALSENIAMRQSIYNAVTSEMPTVAECGGFLYLGKQLQGSDGKSYPMAGVLPGSAEKKARLVRFGYTTLTAEKDSMLFRKGEKIPAHEFHYWDSTENGSDLQAVKPVSGRAWRCGFAGEHLYAGFPHLYFAGRPVLAQRFVKAAAAYQTGGTGGAGR